MTFPQQQIEDAIRDEIQRAAADSPVPKATWEPEIDSLTAVRIVCRIERDFGISLPDDCMPKGGFEGVNECVAVMTERCRQKSHEKEKTKGEPVS